MTQYIQCDLRKGDVVDTAWIEDKNLAVGKTVEIKRGDGVRDPDWRITAMYGAANLEEINREGFKKHRARADI